MSELIQAILIGIIQGLTEFLPVSSSGHIELTKYFLGYEPKDSLLFTVVVHFATALSTIVVFRKEITKIFSGLFKMTNNNESKYSLLIIISMVPAALMGVFFDDFIDSLFEGQIILVAICLLITALLLYLADQSKLQKGTIGWKEALIIGVAQAIAILPGMSRSGATVSTSILLKIERKEAAKFSFLMVIPLIFGKMAKDIMDGAFTSLDISLLPLIGGFVAAFFVGILACKLMIQLVVKSKLIYFSIYCTAIATFTIIWYTLH